MAFGDTARGALQQALEAWKACVQLQAIIERVEKAAESFEKRHESRVDALEQRTADQLRHAEARIRDLEATVASLKAKVDAGFVEAMKLVLLQPEVTRRIAESNAQFTVASSTEPATQPNGKDRSRPTA